MATTLVSKSCIREAVAKGYEPTEWIDASFGRVGQCFDGRRPMANGAPRTWIGSLLRVVYDCCIVFSSHTTSQYLPNFRPTSVNVPIGLNPKLS